MNLTLAHYRNRFCMFRTYYALANGIVKPDDFSISVIEVPDPPSHAHEEALISGEVQIANLYLAGFLRCRLGGAPIVGLATEWKSTLKGNGLFVLKDGPVKKPADLAGRSIATQHMGPHMVHRFLLKRFYGVDDTTLSWGSYPQEELLIMLKEKKVDAVVLIDQFFFHGETDPDVSCLYTDGQAWKALFGFPEFIKHMIAAREDLIDKNPELREKLLRVFRASFAYSEGHLEEIAVEFLKRYPGEREALLASARYPRIEFTFTEEERRLALAQMDMLIETKQLSEPVPLSTAFVV